MNYKLSVLCCLDYPDTVTLLQILGGENPSRGAKQILRVGIVLRWPHKPERKVERYHRPQPELLFRLDHNYRMIIWVLLPNRAKGDGRN